MGSITKTAGVSQAQRIYPAAGFEAPTSELLRRAFGTYATGIAVIGARGADGTLVGMTANSFTSVSLNPPLVLFCPARTLSSFKAYSTTTHFSASILPAGAEGVSNHFARSNSGKWSAVAHGTSETGMPFLDFALACFECEVVARHDAGDHLIVLGQVLQVQLADWKEPLVFFRSRYRQLDALAQPAASEEEPPFSVWG
ncbi:MAG: flavin reductase [Betaproteobacteria bacterium]|nr:MAG: flavin reductase [Betaproteobacteria bacterium]